MQFSIGVEYSLHCLLYLVGRPAGESLGVRELARFQGVSETYLSKVFTKLRKDGIVRSTPGVKGGYLLAKKPEDISFWDVVQAVEGASYMFQCTGILRNIAILDREETTGESGECPCLIKDVMHDAEDKMREYLKSKSLHWLNEEVKKITTSEYQDAVVDWFATSRK